jgi:hypothetical protein
VFVLSLSWQNDLYIQKRGVLSHRITFGLRVSTIMPRLRMACSTASTPQSNRSESWQPPV